MQSTDDIDPIEERERLQEIVSRCQAAVLPALMAWRLDEMNRDELTASLASDALCIVLCASLCTEAVFWCGQEITENHRKFVELAIVQITEVTSQMLSEKELPKNFTLN